MADDITLTVGFSDVVQAEKAAAGLEKRFNDLVKSSKRNASSQDALYATFKKLDKAGLSLTQVFSSIDKDQKSAANSAAKLETATLKLSLANKSARESARAMEAAFKAEAAALVAANKTTQAAKNARRALRMEFKEGYAAQVQYRAARMRLNQAEREGIITAEQAAVAQKNLGIAVQQGGRHMSRTGVMTQQAGYQIGDFLVQVQGGTNPMVAFGQQATQLVGALYMLPSATIAAKVGIMGLSISVGALIAVAGIMIPLLTAIGAAFMRTRAAAKEASDGTETFEDKLKSARQQVRGMKDDLRLLQSGFKETFQLTLSDSVDKAKLELKEAKETLKTLTDNLYSLGNIRQGLRLVTPFTGDPVQDKKDAEERVRLAEEELLNAQELVRQANQRARDESTVNQLYEARQIIAELQKEADLKRENTLTRIRGLMGEISSEALVLTQEVANAAVELGLGYEEALKLQEEMEKAEGFALGITKADMASGIRAAAAEALTLAGNMGISLGLAQQLVAMSKKSQAENLFDTKVRTGAIPPQAAEDFNLEGGSETPFALKAYMDAVDKAVKERERASRESSKSGGGSTGSDSQLQSFLASIQTEREAIKSWYGEQQELLATFNESELEIIGGQAEAKLRIEQEYQSKMQALRNTQLSDSANFFGALAGVAAAGGEKMVKAVQVFSATQALINSYVAYTEVLKDPSFIGRPLARFAAAAGVLTAGLNMVQAIKGVGGGGGGGSTSGGSSSASGADATVTAQATATPQRVIIEGIDRDSLISGEQLSNIFEALYKENEDRGFVFEVAT